MLEEKEDQEEEVGGLTTAGTSPLHRPQKVGSGSVFELEMMGKVNAPGGIHCPGLF